MFKGKFSFLFLLTLMSKFAVRKVNKTLFFITLQISAGKKCGKLWKTVEICKVQWETAASWRCVCPIQLQILPQLAASKCLQSHLNMVYTLQHPTICACNSAYYLFAYFQPPPPPPYHPLPHCLSLCYSRTTVCSLFSHIICNNLHLHIPTAVMATERETGETRGEGRAREGRNQLKLPE